MWSVKLGPEALHESPNRFEVGGRWLEVIAKESADSRFGFSIKLWNGGKPVWPESLVILHKRLGQKQVKQRNRLETEIYKAVYKISVIKASDTSLGKRQNMN